ncbi:hypothetical protein FHR65_002177 [Xanthomonas arboricola]|uniref:Uncharacterized protein n=1 Tax=Xanthomonas arboricola TaxID=56448 RepID=A0AB73GXB4_9XANT|nr:hypothetical protein [Xanthomonas arboricola]
MGITCLRTLTPTPLPLERGLMLPFSHWKEVAPSAG